MHEINRVLKKAAWRVGVMNFMRGWVMAAGALIAAAIVLRIAEQLFGLTDVSRVAGVESDRILSAVLWEKVLYWGLGATVVAALAWAIMARPKPSAVARRVDEGANLREALSTALFIKDQSDPWSRATVESATRTARGVNVSQAVPIQPPRFWPVVVGLALGFAVVWMAMPRLDVLGWFASAQAEQKKQVDIINAVREVKEVERKIEELTSRIPSLEKEKADEPAAADKPEPRTAEEIRKAAISDLTRLSDRLEQLKSGENARKLEAMQAQLKNLKHVPGESSELSKALARGDFSQARSELEKLKDQLGSGEMSAEAREKAAEAMEKLAEQIAKAAQNQERMKKALEQAGINPDAIKDPASARQAIQEAGNLTQEQKQQMQQMLDAAMQSQEAMQAMSSAMQKMAEGMKQSSQSEGRQGSEAQKQAEAAAQQLSQQMAEMEQIQQEMEMAEATMNECQQALNQLGKEGDGQGMGECQGGMGGNNGMGSQANTGRWSDGISQSQGQGQGGPGRGEGGRSGESAADFEMEKKKFIGAKGNGPIVSSRLVEGDSIRGESKAEFARVVASAEQGATEAIENNTIPREYHDAIKSYFGRLKSKAQKAASEKAPDDKPAEPAAEPARDGK